MSASTDALFEFGDGRFTMRLADQSAFAIPVAQLGRDRLLVAVSVEETNTYFFMGWITRDSATHIQIAGGAVQTRKS